MVLKGRAEIEGGVDIEIIQEGWGDLIIKKDDRIFLVRLDSYLNDIEPDKQDDYINYVFTKHPERTLQIAEDEVSAISEEMGDPDRTSETPNWKRKGSIIIRQMEEAQSRKEDRQRLIDEFLDTLNKTQPKES